MTTLPKPHFIPALGGVRAFIAWWVVLFHAQSHLLALVPEFAGFLRPIVGSGHMRVDIFFVLSGFVLSYRYAPEFRTPRGTGYLSFVLRRLWRIYPLHVLTLLVLLLLAGVAGLSGRDPGLLRNSGGFDVVTNLLLIQAWILPMKFSWNYPAWSLSSEWLAYLTFPVMSALLWRIRSAWAAFAGATVLLIGMSIVCTWMLNIGVYGYDFMIRLVTEFTAGCLLYHVFRAGILRHWRWNVLTPTLFVAALILGVWMEVQGYKVFWLVLLFALFLLGLAHEVGPAKRLFESRLMQYWGRRSYSLYITHALSIYMFAALLPAAGFGDSGLGLRILVLGVYLCFLALVGALTYRFLEEPLRRMDVDRLLFRRRKAFNAHER